MRAALARRDIGAVYRRLTDVGFSQRQIAALTGQSQSEISEILRGREVLTYPLLMRIADGLGIARGCMGLAAALDHRARPALLGLMSGARRRRALLAAATEALLGDPALGAAPEPPEHPENPEPPTPLPSRLAARDVTALRALTQQLETLARAYGGSAEMLSQVAVGAERLMSVPGPGEITRALTVAIGELHATAGWAAFDAHQDVISSYHFARAMELSAEDGVAFGKAAYLSGVATAERGYHNDGLKLLQLGAISLDSVPAMSRTRELASWLAADSALVLAEMDQPDAARRALAMARDSWCAPNADDQADMAWVMALAELALGRLETAQRLAASAVGHWAGTADRRQAVLGAITLAVIHVRAGEPDAHDLAHRAITEVAELRSARARRRLAPLIVELRSRSSVSSWQLASLAGEVAAVGGDTAHGPD